jgi:hypothetical protein
MALRKAGDGPNDTGTGEKRALGPQVPLVQPEWILALLFGYSVEAIERFETRLPALGRGSHVPVVDGSITVATRGELSPDVAHVNNPL